jgi:prolyl oligopeptidase
MSNADDDRVNPMHARKFVAAIQAANPTGTALLRIERSASHSGAFTEASWIDSEADAYAFAHTAVSAHTAASSAR